MKAVVSWFGISCLLAGVLVGTTACASVAAQPSDATMQTAPASAVASERLDVLLAPVALYPDALLAQVLMASTFPEQVIDAAAWQKRHPDLSDAARETALYELSWDASVKSLVAVPNVLQQMAGEPDWMNELGAAVLADQPLVLSRVQFLRQQAMDTGHLVTSDKQVVTTGGSGEDEAGNPTITIASPSSTVIYVPTYDTRVVYGAWWWPTAPYLWRTGIDVWPTSGFWWSPGIGFRFGLWGGFSWSNGWLTINAPVYRNYYRRPPLAHPRYAPINNRYVWWRPGPPPRHVRPPAPPRRPMAVPRPQPRAIDRPAINTRPMIRPDRPQARPQVRPNPPQMRPNPPAVRPTPRSQRPTVRPDRPQPPRAQGNVARPPQRAQAPQRQSRAERPQRAEPRQRTERNDRLERQ